MTQIFAIGIFALVYAIILAGENSPRKLDRPTAGLVGAVLMVLTGVLSRSEGWAAIDFGTLALLFGMMVLIHYATVSGLLDLLASHIVQISRTPKQLLWIVCMSAGVLSALFVNDTICLLMTPMVILAAKRKGIGPEPHLLALATGSNVGSLMTLTGNPQNMLIGQTSGWLWGAFALRMVPIGLVCLLINACVVQAIYRKEMELPGPGVAPEEQSMALDRRLAFKTAAVLAGLLGAFLLGAPMDLAAMTAAVAIMVLANRKHEETFEAIDWSLLLFFGGLFVVVEGVTKVEGARIAHALPLVVNHRSIPAELALFSGASVLGSNLFSNVPFVMLLRGWIVHLPHARLLWLSLAASSTLAGNLTMVGSVANLIVAQKAKDDCALSFWSFLRVGVVSTLLTVAASVGILSAYAALGWV